MPGSPTPFTDDLLKKIEIEIEALSPEIVDLDKHATAMCPWLLSLLPLLLLPTLIPGAKLEDATLESAVQVVIRCPFGGKLTHFHGKLGLAVVHGSGNGTAPASMATAAQDAAIIEDAAGLRSAVSNADVVASVVQGFDAAQASLYGTPLSPFQTMVVFEELESHSAYRITVGFTVRPEYAAWARDGARVPPSLLVTMSPGSAKCEGGVEVVSRLPYVLSVTVSADSEAELEEAQEAAGITSMHLSMNLVQSRGAGDKAGGSTQAQGSVSFNTFACWNPELAAIDSAMSMSPSNSAGPSRKSHSNGNNTSGRQRSLGGTARVASQVESA